jgi:hypothetical protein
MKSGATNDMCRRRLDGGGMAAGPPPPPRESLEAQANEAFTRFGQAFPLYDEMTFGIRSRPISPPDCERGSDTTLARWPSDGRAEIKISALAISD